MKYLEAKSLSPNTPEENKMQSGSRPDQQVAPNILARQIGVNIDDVRGTGANGAVTNRDIREHAKKVRAENQKTQPVSSPKNS